MNEYLVRWTSDLTFESWLPEVWEPSVGVELKRRKTTWWKGDFWLDGMKFTNLGLEPVVAVAAFESGKIAATDESPDSLPLLEAAGATTSEIAFGSTLVCRFNITPKAL